LRKYIFLKKIKPTVIPAIGWLLISTLLLTIPGSAFPTENWLSKIWFDKWVHIGMFALMTFLWCWALHKKKILRVKFPNVFIGIGIICLLYGVAMEFVQEYIVVNRSFDTGDIIADAAGCLLGVIYSVRRL
jgi:VanZ family protein